MIKKEAEVIFAKEFSDPVPDTFFVSKERAHFFFQYFRQCPLFRWRDANNDCEDRANAIYILLQKWNIPCMKAWVFAGMYLGKDSGNLRNYWNYHVAAVLPVQEENTITFYVIDPAMLEKANTVENWATLITETPHSYYAVKDGAYYIFNPSTIEKGGWYKQNRQNFKWTIQGLAGINGVSMRGKAHLVFNKRRIQRTEKAFRKLMTQRPT